MSNPVQVPRELLERLIRWCDDGPSSEEAQALLSQPDAVGDGWIACSDRMPEKYESVLVAMDVKGELIVRNLMISEEEFAGERQWCWSHGMFIYPDLTRAKFWRPLPNPPSKRPEAK